MFGKIAKFTTDCALFALLCFQSALLIIFMHQGYWDIPTWMLTPVFKEKNQSNLDLNVEQARFYPKKGIEIKGASFNSDDCMCPLVKIEEIVVLYPEQGLRKATHVQGIVKNVVLYFPDPHLPESANLKLLHGLSFQFRASEDEVIFDSLQANISNLKIVSAHPLKLPMELLESGSNPEEGPDEDEILEKLKEVRLIHDYFKDALDASLIFTFEALGNQTFASDFQLFAGSSRMPKHGITSQGIHLSGRLLWANDELIVDGGVTGELGALKIGEHIALERVSIGLIYKDTNDDSIIPDQILFHSPELRYDTHEFAYLSALVTLEQLGSGVLDVHTGLGGQYLDAQIRYDFDAKQSQITLDADLDPIRIAREWLGDTDSLNLISFGKIPRLQASVNVNNWKEFDNIQYSIASEEVMLKGANFAYVRANGIWDKQSVILDHFVASQPGYSLTGKLVRNPETTDYRYLLTGKGIPTDLNSMFRPWWTSLWKNFDFHGNPVVADIDIWGTDNDQSKRFAFGAIGINNIEYKGLQINWGEVKLNVISKYVDIFDLFIEHPLGIATGRVENIYQHDGRLQVSQRLDVFSNIPFHDLAPLIGEELDPFVENTNEDVAPTVHVKGAVIKKAFPQYKHLDNLTLDIFCDEPFEIFGFRMDGVQTQVRKEGDIYRVNPIHFKFAKGHGKGMVAVFGPEDSRSLEFAVDVDDFDFRTSIDKIAAFDPKEEDDEFAVIVEGVEEGIADADEAVVMVDEGVDHQPESANDIEKENGEEVVKESRLGRIKPNSFTDLVFTGGSPIQGDLSGLVGIGNFELVDPLIHRVHIFGGISKVLDNAELNMGSFSLKKATSSVRWESEKVYLDDLVLTGPSSRVKSKGVIYTQTGELDFRLKAYPLKEVKFPVVAGLAMVLKPFAHMFEMKLSGTFEDPEWKLVIDPSGL